MPSSGSKRQTLLFVSLFVLSDCVTGWITTVHKTANAVKFLQPNSLSNGRTSGNNKHSPELLQRWKVASVEAPTGTAGLWGERPIKMIIATYSYKEFCLVQNSVVQQCWQCLLCKAILKQPLSVPKFNYFLDIFPIKSFRIHVSLCLMCQKNKQSHIDTCDFCERI